MTTTLQLDEQYDCEQATWAGFPGPVRVIGVTDFVTACRYEQDLVAKFLPEPTGALYGCLRAKNPRAFIGEYVRSDPEGAYAKGERLIFTDAALAFETQVPSKDGTPPIGPRLKERRD